jgi:hypothetical protein
MPAVMLGGHYRTGRTGPAELPFGCTIQRQLEAKCAVSGGLLVRV